MGNYPKELIDDYRGGKINRARFIQLFKQWQINNTYYSGEANEATLHADYEKRTYCIKARDEFLKQAEKWGALWT